MGLPERPSTPQGARVAELEDAIRETQTRALLMAEMRLTDFQRRTLANVLEPLSLAMSEQPPDTILGGLDATS